MTDSTYTNNDGYFSKDLEAGIYSVFYTHDGYQPYLLPEDIGVFNNLSLDNVTLIPGTVVEVSGAQNGTWTSDHQYQVIGDVNINEGDTLIIEPGVHVLFMDYSSFLVEGTLLAQGTEEDSIYFTSGKQDVAEGDWDEIKISGPNSSNTIVSYSNIDFACNGLYLYLSSPYIHHNTIQNNLDSGILCKASYDLTIPIISYNVIRNNRCLDNNSRAGISVNSSKASPTIQYNQIYNNENSGIDTYGQGLIYSNHVYNNSFDGIVIGDGIYQVQVISNIVHDNGFHGNGVGHSGDNCDAIFVNNIIYNHYHAGLNIFYTNDYVINNTFYNNGYYYGSDPCDGALQVYSQSDPLIINNLFYNNRNGIHTNYSDITLSTVEYNLFHNNDNNIKGDGAPDYFGNIVSTNANGDSCDTYYNIFCDPCVIDPDSYNFHYLSDSPCINAGIADTSGLHIPIYDIDGNPRIYDDIIDIGVYEWNGYSIDEPNLNNVPQEYFLTNHPNPFRNNTKISYINWEMNNCNEYYFSIYNVKGQLIKKTLFTDRDIVKHFEINWDGADMDGNQCPPGIYLYSIS